MEVIREIRGRRSRSSVLKASVAHEPRFMINSGNTVCFMSFLFPVIIRVCRFMLYSNVKMRP